MNLRRKRKTVDEALAKFVERRHRLRILDLAGKIEFNPEWDYKRMRHGRSR